MGFKKFSVNEYLTDSDVNTYFAQQVVALKTSTESVTSSTTLQDDNQLTMTVSANTTYWVDLFLITDGLTTADIKLAMFIPSGTIRWNTNGLDVAASGTLGDVNRRVLTGGAVSGADVGTVGSGTSSVIPARGIARIGATGGTMWLQWAQNTSQSTATRILAGSMLRALRVRA